MVYQTKFSIGYANKHSFNQKINNTRARIKSLKQRLYTYRKLFNRKDKEKQTQNKINSLVKDLAEYEQIRSVAISKRIHTYKQNGKNK